MFSGKKKELFPKYPAVGYECGLDKAMEEISGFWEEVVEEGRLTFFVFPLTCLFLVWVSFLMPFLQGTTFFKFGKWKGEIHRAW